MLPKIDAPTYTITLPVSKVELTFRPFLVKEQKILLMAMESQEEKTIQTNIKQILQNCAITDIDINLLPMVDVEFYYLNLRAKSVGEIVETRYKCENIVNDAPCDTELKASYNILEVDLKIPKNNELIPLTDKIGIKMKYPNFSVIDRLKDTDLITDIAFDLIIECIDYIYDGDTLFYAHETEKAELNEFLEGLTQEQFDKIDNFIDNLPSIEKQLEMKCPGCGFEHKVMIKDLNSFFQ